MRNQSRPSEVAVPVPARTRAEDSNRKGDGIQNVVRSVREGNTNAGACHGTEEMLHGGESRA